MGMNKNARANGRMKPGEQKAARRICAGAVKRQRNCCYWCGAGFSPANPATADHVKPWSEGGQTKNRTIVAACGACNMERGRIQVMKKMIKQGRVKRLTPRFWFYALPYRMGL
jgi:hypothetical protein